MRGKRRADHAGRHALLSEARDFLVEAVSELPLTDPNNVDAVIQFLNEMIVDGHGFPVDQAIQKSDVHKLRATVVANEQWLMGVQQDASVSKWHYRDGTCRKGHERLRRHAQIVEQLLTEVRPCNDEGLRFGPNGGGALPAGGASLDGHAVIVMGPPASGKSYICAKLAHHLRALVIDPDDAKRLLPEFKGGVNAHMLHEESSAIAKGANGLLDCALDARMNFVLPTVGVDSVKLKEIREQIVAQSYIVYLVHVFCPPEIAAVRSLMRTISTGRYVPLRHILCEVGERPAKAYRTVKSQKAWAGVAEIDSGSPKDQDGFVFRLNGRRGLDAILNAGILSDNMNE